MLQKMDTIKVGTTLIAFIYLMAIPMLSHTCVLSADAFEKPEIEHEILKAETWNSESLVYSALLKDGRSISVKYWACNYLGMDAELRVFGYLSKKKIVKYFSELARIAMAVDEALMLKKALSEPSLKVGLKIPITNPQFSDFWIQAMQSKSQTKLKISYRRIED